MKLTINVDATPQEFREFLGLPNVQPLQDEMLKIVHENMRKGATGFDPATLMKPLLPQQMQSMEMWQQVFWDAFAKASAEPLKVAEKQKK